MNLIALVRCECMSVELVFVCVPLDEFGSFKCFVHVPYSEVEAEVQDGISGLFLTALLTPKSLGGLAVPPSEGMKALDLHPHPAERTERLFFKDTPLSKCTDSL